MTVRSRSLATAPTFRAQAAAFSASRSTVSLSERAPAKASGPGERVEGSAVLARPAKLAMAIASEDEQLRLREELIAFGSKVTEVRDRCYFKSIYFREPGGVLFEVATIQPGFTADEDLGALGRGLKLPPWEEPHRAIIEAKLPAVAY